MIEEIKNSDFTDVLNSKLAVVDFSAVWCGPCQMLAPIMEELSDEMDGEVDFFSADVDENRDLAYQLIIPHNGTSVAVKTTPHTKYDTDAHKTIKKFIFGLF